ncbi:MAG: hypothetical protein HC914_03375 [Chloroflexaceae bacterium]|nr:hypothetical protein [Chloroflexaceae bacterium]
MKAAAWWVRTHSAPTDVVFADSAYEPYQLWYYVRRPFIGVTDAATSADAYLLLPEQPVPPQWYLVVPDNEHLLATYAPEPTRLAARVLVDQQPVLLVYQPASQPIAAVVDIESTAANAAFDMEYGTLEEMFSLGR